jgi:hypothetical protein
VGRVETAEIGDKGSKYLRVPSFMSPLVEVAVELVEVEGEEGGVGVKELVVSETGCGQEGEAELESFRDVFIDAHDHPLVVAFDEF